VAAVFRTQGVPDSYFFDVHVGGTQRLLDAAQAAGVRRFVHISTVGVQGKITKPPADETAPFAPGDIYQRSKLEGELVAMAHHKATGFPVTVVRPAGIYGPGDMRFLKLFKAIKNGTFWMIGSGETVYHFTYISDLVKGMILAAHNEDAVGEVFTVAGEEVITIAGLVELIGETLGVKTPRRHIPVGPVMLAARLSEAVCRPFGINPPLYPRRLDFFIKDRSFDISKAKRVLGYQPEVDLRTGLACTADWYRAQGYL
jgi:nucleoside-diphosphate-sugar epimerase